MKVLWLCNVMLPVIAEEFHIEASNKEGWLSGLADTMLKEQQNNGIHLFVACPAPAGFLAQDENLQKKKLIIRGCELTGYFFREDTVCPDRYDPALEQIMDEIIKDCAPDLVHCFGTEYPHTLAMCRKFPDKKKILITIQGLCSVYANVYYADLPSEVIHRETFRDRLKQDSITEQREKYKRRGEAEIEAVKLAGNVGGRTAWDRHYVTEWNPSVRYFQMNETLRKDFYEERWKKELCEAHSIFLSQGDYPIKGLHYMLLALPEILCRYEDVHVYVAGNSIVNYKTVKDRIKISSYGKYLRKLMQEGGLSDRVTFLGKLSSSQMKERYLKSSLFVCCSAIENSPNSLGEAMLLGMPCVTADVGGIPSIFTGGEDGITYPGCKSRKNSFDHTDTDPKSPQCGEANEEGATDDRILRLRAAALSDAILKMWDDPQKQESYCLHAREHAMKNHDRQGNYRQTLEVYRTIAGEGGEV